ncbi:phage tail protein [uncultured Desulfovibrio sp.]|uniref:phage tail protein n=1 Tax=uncultured Desulfovibrio sp. TaxID=167968 RepID=UPI0025982F7E|nr:phage tail protein [uncultured Desulfovibrio sp.]
MMYQGLLGAFPFTVSELEVCTFRDLKVTREQVYAEHKTLAGLPKLQHTGRNLDPLSLAVQIVPLTAVSTVGLRLCALAAVAESGDELALVIGLKYYGLFVLKSYEITHRQLHHGVTLAAEVQLSLMEYH